MKLLYLFSILLAYVLAHTMPKAIEYTGKIRQQREAQEFMLQWKGIVQVEPKTKKL